jgi:hypothetical protein
VQAVIHPERRPRIKFPNARIETNSNEWVVWHCPEHVIDNSSVALELGFTVFIQGINPCLPSAENSDPVGLRNEGLLRTDMILLDQGIARVKIGNIVVMIV